MRITLPLTLGAVLALTLATIHAGGWAIVTLEDLPQQLLAGKPTTLTFSVRQHGMRLVGSLSGRIVARSGNQEVSAAALGTDRTGYYRAALTVPSPGQWTITIDSGWPGSNVTLRPIPVMASETAAAAPTSARQRGEELFVAKGCGGCHRHDAAKTGAVVPYFVDLTARRYPDAFLAQLLKDPSMIRSANGQWEMPNLNLRDQEIAALVAFINKPRVTAGR